MAGDRITLEPTRKRVRVIFNGKTLADTLGATLLLEAGHLPVYYLPSGDVRMDLLQPTRHRSHCPYKGEASYWSLGVGERAVDNAAWSYPAPLHEMSPLAGLIAFYWDRVDHWFEEDEEIFGHPRDPHHRIDVRPSSREVRVRFGGELVAVSRRSLFLFETSLPTRYYIAPADVRKDLLQRSEHRSTCPYKGQAAYWSLHVNGGLAQDAVWGYPEPLPECPRIKDHFCFDPEKVELRVEGEAALLPFSSGRRLQGG